MQLPILWHTALNFIKDSKGSNGLLVCCGGLCDGFRGDEAETEALAVAKAFRVADGEFSRKFHFSVKVCD